MQNARIGRFAGSRTLEAAYPVLWLAAVLLVLPAGRAEAQTAPVDLLAQIRESFRRLDYAQVDVLADQAVAAHSEFKPEELVEIHTLRGLAHYYRGEEAAAREQFESALTLDPGLRVDPLLAAPQALAFFSEVRERFERSSPGSSSPAAVRYVVIQDRRPAAAVRSFLVPGWGQLYKQERAKGVALVALWAGTAGGGLAAHFAHARARDAYEAAGAGEVADRYDTMNRRHKLRKRLAYAALAVWAVSAVDAVVSGGPRTRAVSTASGLSLSVDPEALRPRLLLRAQF